MKNCVLLNIIFCCSLTLSYAQITHPVYIDQDSIINQLPFEISDEKRLSKEDVINKREGWYVTGLPEPKVDPIKGFGIGTHIYLFNNTDRSDPFFYFTPYRVRYGLAFRTAQSGQFRTRVNFDMPFAFNTKWRFRGDIVYEEDPNWQYYGIGTNTLRGLNFTDKRTGQFFTNANMSNYKNNLALTRPGRGAEFGETASSLYTDRYYNEFRYKQFMVALAAEHTFFDGRMRLMLGYEMLFANVGLYDNREVEKAVDPKSGERVNAIQGRTKLMEDFLLSQQPGSQSIWSNQNLQLYDRARIANLQTSIMWDTRDLEPDPGSGMFLEFSNELSSTWVGSQYNFSKHLVQAMFFKKLFPDNLGKTVFASRFALGGIRGSNIPFTELLDQWNATFVGGIKGLGGESSLRGYKEYRFVGMVTGWMNLELRSRFYQTNVFNQHLAFSIVPFYDAGRVWDNLKQLSLDNFRGSPGLGARIAWNQATVLRFDYATSAEDDQFFFTLEHPF